MIEIPHQYPYRQNTSAKEKHRNSLQQKSSYSVCTVASNLKYLKAERRQRVI